MEEQKLAAASSITERKRRRKSGEGIEGESRVRVPILHSAAPPSDLANAKHSSLSPFTFTPTWENTLPPTH